MITRLLTALELLFDQAPRPRVSYIECNSQVLGTSALDVKRTLLEKITGGLAVGRDRYIDRGISWANSACYEHANDLSN